MTKENVAGQGTLPDPQTAYNTITHNVHYRVFFNKLAAAGIEPANEKEAQDLIQLAGNLRVAQSQVKEASVSRFAAPLQQLNSVLEEDGYLGQAQDGNLHVKAAAAQLLADPEIYNSILSLKAYEAEQFNAQVQNS